MMDNSNLRSINDLKENEFQDFCNSILIESLGINVRIGGDGRDGGRDSIYEGELRFPNTSNPPTGNWCIQCKFHNLEKISRSQRPSLIITDLKREYEKFVEMQNLLYDSYFFMTNVELTWVKDSGSLDRIDDEIKPLFNKIGFKNFIVWDGNQIRGIFSFIPKTIEKFLKVTESKDQNSQLILPKAARDNKVVKIIMKQFSRGFENTTNPNPHIRCLISWQYQNHSFYLLTATSQNTLQSLIEIVELLMSNEILCVYGSKTYLDRLKDKIRFLPIPITQTETKIMDRLLNFEEYMV